MSGKSRNGGIFLGVFLLIFRQKQFPLIFLFLSYSKEKKKERKKEMGIKETVQYAKNLKKEDLKWQPLYPNNMPVNGLQGCYCCLWIKNRDGKYDGRKYTVLFQEKEDERGCTIKGEVEFYILFEKSYHWLDKPLVHPEPSDNRILSIGRHEEGYDVNDYGTFVRAYTSENKARERALLQFKMVYGYALSRLIEREDNKK